MPSARPDERVSRVYLPFTRLGMCLDCESCFEIGSACPACGSRTWMPLARFLETARRRRLVQAVESFAPGKATGAAEDRALHYVIVARDREALYQHFKESFAGNPTITVILDRRHGERRGGAPGVGPERRAGDRRWKSVNEQLRVLGWAVVRVGADASTTSGR